MAKDDKQNEAQVEAAEPDTAGQTEVDTTDEVDGVAAEPSAVEEAVESAADPTEVPDTSIDPQRVVEAVLMAADAPITAQKIAGIMGTCSGRDVKKHIEALNGQYDEWGVAFRVEQLAGGYQILTQPQFNTWLKKLLRVRAETKLTGASMETLAIVAYKQPCTRADVEAIRGVAVGDGLNRLREINLVKIVGRAEDLGRPILYGTTRRFLEVFGLASLDDLPQVEALKPGGKAVAKSAAQADASDDEGVEAASRADDDVDDVADDALNHDGADAEDAIVETGDVEGGETPSLALVNDDEETLTADEQRRAANE